KAGDDESRVLAAMVCENEVRSVVESAIRGPLTTPQQGTWRDATHYVCTYPVGTGDFTMTVQVAKSGSGAKKLYERARTRAPKPQRLNGLGQAAYQDRTGVLVARKDRFLLTADPTTLPALPAGLNKGDVAFAAAV